MNLGLTPSFAWLLLACSFVLLEMMIPGFFSIWLAAGALCTSIVVAIFPDIPLLYQIILASFFVIISLLLSQLVFNKYPPHCDNPTLNQWESRYINRVFYLNVPIHHGHAKINLDASIWNVSGPDCPVGTKVKIVAMDGLLLLVEPVIETRQQEV